jgi:hypothetical protein
LAPDFQQLCPQAYQDAKKAEQAEQAAREAHEAPGWLEYIDNLTDSENDERYWCCYFTGHSQKPHALLYWLHYTFFIHSAKAYLFGLHPQGGDVAYGEAQEVVGQHESGRLRTWLVV